MPRKSPFAVVQDFENVVADYTGAPYCVAVNSCSSALFLALAYFKFAVNESDGYNTEELDNYISIPKHTYISVPMQIKHAGFEVKFRDENWKGIYQLLPYPIYDSARRFKYNMYNLDPIKSEGFVCLSFHWSKILGIQQGGAILHSDSAADKWLRKARFDGRTEGVAPKDDNFDQPGWHMYMSPEIAAAGLVRMNSIKQYNEDLLNDEYPDLSQIELFKEHSPEQEKG